MIKQKKIKNVESYLNGLKNSLEDKMFFSDIMDESIDTFVDFGCASGDLISLMKQRYPNIRYIGYDNNENMISLAKSNDDGCEFYTRFVDIKDIGNNAMINLSSVIHEIYSYNTLDEAEGVLKTIFNSNFKYISIRDMMTTRDADVPITDDFDAKLRKVHPERLKDFEYVWGKVTTCKAAMHYLLKCEYVENWEREVKENYFPVCYEDFLSLIPDDYEIVLCKNYILPYLYYSIEANHNIRLADPTHIRIILKKKVSD